jgi:Rnl2 family RNA ligase
VTEVCIYGELFGGVYPHPEVKDLGRQPIQKGVYYTPDIEFCAFDVQLVVRDQERKPWLNYRTAMDLFSKCGIFHAQPLVEGTRDECLKMDIRINSTIPARLGLPPLEQNQMEGIVIKSVEPLFFPVKHKFPPRAIVKKKNAKFEEVNPKCETQWEAARRERKTAIETLLTEVERYINVNRLNNLESKIGPVTRANAKEAGVALAEDALKDLAKDYEKEWALMVDDGHQETVQKNVRSMVMKWLYAHLAETEGKE